MESNPLNMKSKFVKVIQGVIRMLKNLMAVIFEACLVLTISCLSLIVLSINYGLNTEGIMLFDAIITTITSTLQPTEMITYVTGILSSTTAYFIVRIRLSVFSPHITRVMVILICTFGLFWVATPLFISGLDREPANQELAATLAVWLGIATLALWLFSLYSQRHIFENIDVSGDRRGRDIVANIENS